MSHSFAIVAVAVDPKLVAPSMEIIDRCNRASRLYDEIRIKTEVHKLFFKDHEPNPRADNVFKEDIKRIKSQIPKVTKQEKEATKPAITLILDAVTATLDPFNENGTMFKDGSRWDWWQIGGRFDGRLHGADIARRGYLSTDELLAWRRRGYELACDEFMADTKQLDELKNMNDEMFKMITGFERGMSKAQYMENFVEYPLSAAVFVRDRIWYENERLGWFGGTTQTECEIKAEASGKAYEGRCIATSDDGSKVISYGDNNIVWDRRFWGRFIERLDPDTVLVGIDFHV